MSPSEVFILITLRVVEYPHSPFSILTGTPTLVCLINVCLLIFYFLINLFIYLFMVVLGLRCCVRAFSS